jgi:hypothetical protein
MKYLKLFENFTKSDNFFDDPNYFGCGCCKNCNGEVDCECCDNCGTTIYDDNQNDEEWAGGTFKSDNDKYKEYLRDLESGRINSIDDIEDEEEYDPYSYEGCGCCPVCTGEKDCECGCSNKVYHK